jgi:hypothetical protein
MSATLTLPRPVLQLEEKTTISLRQIRQASTRSEKSKLISVWLLGVPLIPDLLSLQKLAGNGIELLNSPECDGLSAKDMLALAHTLNQILGKLRSLLRMYEQLQLRHAFLYSRVLNRLEDQVQHLSTIVEGLYLSLNETFCEAMESVSEDLKTASGTPERSNLVGHV